MVGYITRTRVESAAKSARSWQNVCGTGGGWWKVGRTGQTTGRITSSQTDYERQAWSAMWLRERRSKGNQIGDNEQSMYRIQTHLSRLLPKNFPPGVILLGKAEDDNNLMKRLDPSARTIRHVMRESEVNRSKDTTDFGKIFQM